MKKYILAFLIFSAAFSLFAQETPDSSGADEETAQDSAASGSVEKTQVIGKVPDSAEDALLDDMGVEEGIPSKIWFKISFNEGVSFCQLTTIAKQEERSNHVRQTDMAGAFVNIKTDDFWWFDFVLQLGAYYPFYYTFNGMRQYPKQAILYAVDGYLGLVYSFDYLKFLPIDISLGMHYMYQLTDQYHMSYVGLGTLDTIEFPISSRWSVINNYFFSYDDANLGTNNGLQKFNASYQYHIDLGVRYSGRVLNEWNYILAAKSKN